MSFLVYSNGVCWGLTSNLFWLVEQRPVVDTDPDDAENEQKERKTSHDTGKKTSFFLWSGIRA